MDWARRRPGVNAERVGINGWCWLAGLPMLKHLIFHH